MHLYPERPEASSALSRRLGKWLAWTAFALAGPASALPPLGAYNVDPAQISVSGFSSGAWFAFGRGGVTHV